MRLSRLTILNGSACTAVFAIALLTASSVPEASAQTQIDHNALVVQLGQALFNDHSLSEPAGMACVTCHDPDAGFSYPNSDVNQNLGPVPGVIPDRFGFRKPPTAAYAAYLPTGIPSFDADVQAYVGGLFYDGRAADTVAQAKAPLLNPNEMNNLLHNVGSPQMVVDKVRNGPERNLFRLVYGLNVFNRSTGQVYELIAEAISAYEKSDLVSPFTSKYDYYLAGQVDLTDDELRGLREVTGSFTGRPGGWHYPINAHCVECHGIPGYQTRTSDLWTNSCYANLGVPKNPNNPYYTMTDSNSNPVGYNPLGADFIDYGLGDFLYPLMGKPVGDLDEGDPLAIDGAFKAPTLRNVDKRPYAGFVKSYMHNGVFKSLEEVVHFYNTRNLTTVPGEVIDFTKPDPYAGLVGTPLWPHPEWPSPITMINPQGLPNDNDVNSMGGEQIGNMGLSDYDEQCIVAFLKTLSDGYVPPRRKPH
ncbi:MAG TPA: cytochrome c peroxidase [Fimbriimonadaceae bacterium]|nr:cytochrome c peroxidase [Fimbriimonadaceae bacterium]